MDASSAPAPPPPAATTAEIAFFDVETTMLSREAGTRYALVEFGAILVCPRRLVEVGSYSTLICPGDTSAFVRCNGITSDMVATAPSFRDVADKIFAILHGRVWAGHNITRFDCDRIREAFAEIGRPGPEPWGLIDTLPLLNQRFGRRAGDMKMATLATYFGLGPQRHRSLDDVRMNLEVLKYCATVLLLDILTKEIIGCGTKRGALLHGGFQHRPSTPHASSEGPQSRADLALAPPESSFSDIYSGRRWVNAVPDRDPSELIPHIEQTNLDPLRTDTAMDGTSAQNAPEASAAANPTGCGGYIGFLEPSEVTIQCISECLLPFHQYGWKILHKDAPLQLACVGLKVHFGIIRKFVDRAGRPKLSFVVDVPLSLRQILDVCDHLAQGSSRDSGSNSEWRPVIKKDRYSDSLTTRLYIPTAASGDAGMYSTEIYHKEQSGNVRMLVFSISDLTELDSLFVPGTIIDAFFSLEAFDYLNLAGLRLVAKRLVVH